MDFADVEVEFKTFVVLIGGEPVAAFRATEDDIKRFSFTDPENDILQWLGAACREGTQQPVWNGSGDITLREAGDDEAVTWMAGLASALCGTWAFGAGLEVEVEHNSFVYFLIPVGLSTPQMSEAAES